MSATALPAELLDLARRQTFEEIELDRHIVTLDFDGERWSYPKSEYYRFEDPVVVERRSARVHRFLSRIAASLRE